MAWLAVRVLSGLAPRRPQESQQFILRRVVAREVQQARAAARSGARRDCLAVPVSMEATEALPELLVAGPLMVAVEAGEQMITSEGCRLTRGAAGRVRLLPATLQIMLLMVNFPEAGVAAWIMA